MLGFAYDRCLGQSEPTNILGPNWWGSFHGFFFFFIPWIPIRKNNQQQKQRPKVVFGRFKVWIVVKETFHFTSWWLNQPISKICSSNWIISPPKKKAFGNPTWTCPWNLSFGNPTKKLPLKKTLFYKHLVPLGGNWSRSMSWIDKNTAMFISLNRQNK